MQIGTRLGSSGLVVLLLAGLSACSTPAAPPPPPEPPAAAGPAQQGEASYYGPQFEGRRTASGERFDPASNTAAHRSLPLGTVAEVKNLRTGRAERVVIRDRGPYVRGRVIDVSPRTAERLGMKQDGTAPVEVKPIAVPANAGGGDAQAAASTR